MARTWIVAADSARARIFEMTPPEKKCREIEDFLNPEGRAQNREINADADGRYYGNGAQYRGFSAGQKISPVEHKTELFSKEVGRYLDKARTQNRYDKLYVIAPPEFLGLMRQNLTREVQKLVADEINKDLSTSAAADIARCIEERRRLR
jgi:protein required for attachment to host cells